MIKMTTNFLRLSGLKRLRVLKGDYLLVASILNPLLQIMLSLAKPLSLIPGVATKPELIVKLRNFGCDRPQSSGQAPLEKHLRLGGVEIVGDPNVCDPCFLSNSGFEATSKEDGRVRAGVFKVLSSKVQHN